MYSTDTILDLVDLIYAAAGDSGRWDTLLERLAGVLGGNIATLHHQNLASTESSFAADWNMAPEAIAAYSTHYAPLNVWFTTHKELLNGGQVFTNEMLCPDDMLVRTEFYNDWLRPNNMGQAVGAMVFKSGPATSIVSVFRGINRPVYGKDQLRLLHQLVPHFQRAFQLHNRIQGLEQKGDAAADVLEHLRVALVMLSAEGKVLLVNKAASAILAGQKGLRVTSRGLVADIPSENQRLQRLIRGAVTTGRRGGLDAGGSILISRGLRRGLQVLVAPLRARAVQIGNDVPVAVVFLSDPDRQPASEVQIFAQLFGLTLAETRLARILAAGNSLKEASEQLGVAQSTVKSQLKMLFAKTGTNGQAQLVRLVLLTLPHFAQSEQ